MKSTQDYVLPAFENKDDVSFLNSWMKKEIALANQRQKNNSMEKRQKSARKNQKQYKIV
jgi:hypothetical protein